MIIKPTLGCTSTGRRAPDLDDVKNDSCKYTEWKIYIENDRGNLNHPMVTLYAGVDPGINYEGLVGVHKSVNIITKGKRGAQVYSTM